MEQSDGHFVLDSQCLRSASGGCAAADSDQRTRGEEEKEEGRQESDCRSATDSRVPTEHDKDRGRGARGWSRRLRSSELQAIDGEAFPSDCAGRSGGPADTDSFVCASYHIELDETRRALEHCIEYCNATNN